jgi:hypothetical protein
MRFLMLLIFAVSSVALAQESYWLSPDVLVVKRSADYHRMVRSSDCRQNIEKVICLVDPMVQGQESNDRPCLAGAEKYVRPFQDLFDRFPRHLQKMFCSLDKIFIEKNFYASAYATLIVDANDKPIGGGIGIRQDFLDNRIGLNHWSSWKEQLNFGGDPLTYDVNKTLQRVHSSLPGFSNFLYFVVAHEFGHLFDFANSLNRFDDCNFNNGQITGTCTAAKGSWTALSWKTIKNDPIDGDDFPLRSSLCFYGCNGHAINPSQMGELYSSLFATNFISVYGAQNMMEDLADTHAYYTVHKYLRPHYSIELQNGQSFNFMKRIESSELKPKVDFWEAFLSNDPKYPGQ